jgi:hypothetical protein
MEAMRLVLLASTLVACTWVSPSDDSSARDRLSHGPARLTVGPTNQAGDVLARRKVRNSWLENHASVSVEGGTLELSADDAGMLHVDDLQLISAPIDLPEDLFDRPAQLRDVVVSLHSPASAVAHWSGDNEAVADVELSLDLDWTIVLDGKPSPLGTAHLSPTPMTLFVGGDGQHVATSFAVHARGTLWSWAELLEITGLDLELLTP